jgi:soluble lytic murein transglycosylase
MPLLLPLLLATATPFDPRWLEPFSPSPPSAAALTQVPGTSPRNRRRVPDTRGEREWAGKYLLGVGLEGQGRWREGEGVFEGLFRDDVLLRDYHAFHAARCHLRRGDAAGALEWSGKVERGAVPEAEARLVALDALRSLHRWSELEAAARDFDERFPAGPRRAEAAFARGQALEELKRPDEAVVVYRRLWAQAPLEGWAARAASRLEQLASEPPSAADLLARGLAFFEHNQSEQAETALAAALAVPTIDPSQKCRAEFHRAMSVWKLRQRTRATPLFENAEAACRAAHDDDLTVRAIYQRARCLSSRADSAAAIAAFTTIEEQFPTHSYADDALLRSAEAASDAGDDADAQARLRRLPERYPRSDNVGEALWRLALRAYQRHDWAEVHRSLETNMRLVPRATVWYAEGRAEYWHARAFEKEGDRAAATHWYQEAARRYPLSLYAWFALARLRDRALVAELRAALPPAEPPPSFPPSALYDSPGFQRALRFARMRLGGEAQRELARLDVSESERDTLLWITAQALDRAGLWSASYLIPRYRLPDFRWRYPSAATLTRWRLSYPRAFFNLVGASSNVPQALLLALMREESGFDPRAESTANCLGLTMLKPDTAAALFGAPLPRERLFDPATSVSLGGRYLASLLGRFGGSAMLALAAYDGGEGSVGRWLKERGQLPPDEFIELIPYDETRNYTKRVLASRFAYHWLYDAREPVPPIALDRPVGR